MNKRIWIMPEERDEKFSLKLIEKVGNFVVKVLGINAFELEIKEQYTTEETPHYHFHISSGLCLDLPSDSMQATYMASADEKEYNGTINIVFRAIRGSADVFRLVVAITFFLYDEFIKEFYPEWKTDYEEIQFSK